MNSTAWLNNECWIIILFKLDEYKYKCVKPIESLFRKMNGEYVVGAIDGGCLCRRGLMTAFRKIRWRLHIFFGAEVESIILTWIACLNIRWISYIIMVFLDRRCRKGLGSIFHVSLLNPWMPNLWPRKLYPSGVWVYPKPKIVGIMPITEQAEAAWGVAEILKEPPTLQRHLRKIVKILNFP